MRNTRSRPSDDDVKAKGSAGKENKGIGNGNFFISTIVLYDTISREKRVTASVCTPSPRRITLFGIFRNSLKYRLLDRCLCQLCFVNIVRLNLRFDSLSVYSKPFNVSSILPIMKGFLVGSDFLSLELPALSLVDSSLQLRILSYEFLIKTS